MRVVICQICRSRLHSLRDGSTSTFAGSWRYFWSFFLSATLITFKNIPHTAWLSANVRSCCSFFWSAGLRSARPASSGMVFNVWGKTLICSRMGLQPAFLSRSRSSTTTTVFVSSFSTLTSAERLCVDFRFVVFFFVKASPWRFVIWSLSYVDGIRVATATYLQKRTWEASSWTIVSTGIIIQGRTNIWLDHQRFVSCCRQSWSGFLQRTVDEFGKSVSNSGPDLAESFL